MSNSDRPVQTADANAQAGAKPACVALVPVVQSAQWTRTSGSPPSRPNSMFVTHLIATAEQLPQTRNLRRATPADAQSAYRASQPHAPGAGIRTRQII